MKLVAIVTLPDDVLRKEWEDARAEDETTQTWEEWVGEQRGSLEDYLTGFWSEAKVEVYEDDGRERGAPAIDLPC